ncbi:MAG TPA: hypothetical protein VK071_04410 [Tissierellales bacterium]|nr:hypothetical protein [Tissierellales bacterium]
MYELTERRKMLLQELQKSQVEYKDNLIESAKKDREYRKLYSQELLIQREKGMQVSILSDVCRGEERVVQAKTESNIADGLAKASLEKINILKIEIRILEEEITAIRQGR